MARDSSAQRGTEQPGRTAGAGAYTPDRTDQGTSREKERAISTNREAAQAPAARPADRGRAAARWEGGASPFAVMQRLADDMDNLFEQFGFGRMGLRHGLGMGSMPMRAPAWASAWSPQVEVSERDDRLVIRADLPGVKKEDVHVDLENDVLTIRGERRDEREEKEKDFYRSERSYGEFYRAIPLPEGVNAESCDATYKDGVLEVSIPTPKPQEPKGRRIEIR